MPLCVPIPIPIIPLRFDACIKIFDVNFMGQNAHLCMDWSARVEMAPLILLHFDCAQFGSEGVSLLKPGQQPDGNPGGFPSVLQPGVGGGGGGGGGAVSGVDTLPVKPIDGLGGGAVSGVDSSGVETLPVKPIDGLGGGAAPPSQPITTNPANGPDENGNLPQVSAGDGDLDPVDDLKHKGNTTRFNTYPNYHYNRF